MSHQHFKIFAKTLEVTLQKYQGQDTLSLLERQRKQIKTLITLERDFREELRKTPKGRKVYIKFIEFIRNDKKNILAARPYFRERQTVFTDSISGALKKQTPSALYRFKINFNFIDFAIKTTNWGKTNEIYQIFNKIKDLRIEIMEQNLPLAISQAKIFYASTPKSHLSWMDLVQIHCGGLLIAIDKFVPPDTKKMTNDESLQAYRKFRAVAIGRMISDRIEQYSETVLHFYPTEKKIIYRANKVLREMSRNGEVDYSKLTELVNQGIEQESQKTTPEKLAKLLAGASCVSGDSIANEDDDNGLSTLDKQVAAEPETTESSVEDLDTLAVMRSTYSKLDLIERKILRMKGVEL